MDRHLHCYITSSVVAQKFVDLARLAAHHHRRDFVRHNQDNRNVLDRESDNTYKCHWGNHLIRTIRLRLKGVRHVHKFCLCRVGWNMLDTLLFCQKPGIASNHCSRVARNVARRITLRRL